MVYFIKGYKFFYDFIPNFVNNGIDVRMMKFKEKDPSETGFEKLLYLIGRTRKTRFSDLMRLKLNDTTKKHMEI